jgi:hypothetical protein
MGERAALTGGHLCIDLTNVEMTGDQQQDLLRAVQATVVGYLAQQSAVSRVVTISMSPNNGQREDEPDERPEPGKKPEPDDKPAPERTPPPRERAN